MIDSPEIGRATVAQKGGCLLRLTPSAILFSNRTGHLAFQFIFHLRLFMFRPALILLQHRVEAQPILVTTLIRAIRGFFFGASGALRSFQKGIDFIEGVDHPAGRQAFDKDLSVVLGEYPGVENCYYTPVPG